jgi:hypothetical protein
LCFWCLRPMLTNVLQRWARRTFKSEGRVQFRCAHTHVHRRWTMDDGSRLPTTYIAMCISTCTTIWFRSRAWCDRLCFTVPKTKKRRT